MKKNFFIIAISCAAIGAGTLSCGSNMNLNMSSLQSAASTGLQALTLTNDQVMGYAQQTVAQMDAQNKVSAANSAYTKRLNNLIGGINHVGDIPLNFKVYETSEVNAFACADGSVRVYSGLMDKMTDDELLGIVGHEIGHVAMEHSKNAFKQSLLNSAALQAVGSVGGGKVGSVLSSTQLDKLASSFMSAKYSRKQENEADDFGYEFLKGAGRNPYAMVESFEKMQAMEGSGNQSAASYFAKMFSSHPEMSERIAHITERCQADGFQRPTKTTTTTTTTKKTTKK